MSQMTITCPNCRNNFAAPVEQILDVGRDPSAKVRFLAGQVNRVRCPNCGYQMAVGTPLAYHDPDKQLLLVNIPMELNLKLDEQERIIGTMTRAITDSLPPEKRKGYLFNPRRTFTLQGMADTILEFDGLTKEMINERREKLKLVEDMLRTSEEELPKLAAENDASLDETFFEMINAAIETAVMNGRRETAEQMLYLRQILLENSSYGKELLEVAARQEAAIERVTQDLNELGDKLTQAKLIDLAISYQDDDEALQALVGLIRPALDYTFFEKLTERIEGSGRVSKQQTLEGLRARLTELTEAVDNQQRAMVQQSAMLLQQIINSPDIEQAVQEALPLIDDLFINVLEATLQDASQRKDAQLALKLQQVYQIISQIMQQSAPPEVQFINELLQTENELETRLLLIERAKEIGPSLLDYMDNLIETLSARGAHDMVARISTLREQAEQVINDGE
ncbi:MAG: hypothetical protein DPW16_01200 [Chloroflexi bacterium]|nr:hypothetical protein [Chloroflexota bacterium]